MTRYAAKKLGLRVVKRSPVYWIADADGGYRGPMYLHDVCEAVLPGPVNVLIPMSRS